MKALSKGHPLEGTSWKGSTRRSLGVAVHPIPAFYFSSLPCSSRIPPGAPSPVHPPGAAWHFAGGASGLAPEPAPTSRQERPSRNRRPNTAIKAQGRRPRPRVQGPRTKDSRPQEPRDRRQNQNRRRGHKPWPWPTWQGQKIIIYFDCGSRTESAF